MKKKLIPILFVIVSAFFLSQYSNTYAAQITEKAGFGRYALKGATLHTITNGTISNGLLLIDKEKIIYAGINKPVPNDYQLVDVSGKHIYPGFMDSGTFLGLREIGAVAVTLDNAEIGQINPHVKAITAINPHSVSIPITRVEGITHAVSYPNNSLISGKAALIDLYGYTPGDMAIKSVAALHIEWPSELRRGWWDTRKKRKNYR